MEYRNVGAHVEDLDNGIVVGVGETIELNDEQLEAPHNQRLVDEGVFISTETPPEKPGPPGRPGQTSEVTEGGTE